MTSGTTKGNLSLHVLTLIRRAFKFGAVGALSTLLGLGAIYLLAYGFNVPYAIANSVVFIGGFAINFLANRFWTFEQKNSKKIDRHIIKTLFVFATAYGIQLYSLYLFKSLLHISEGWAQLPAMAIYTGLYFCGSHFWVYRYK